MLKYPSDLKNARILIANDDGIHSHGIKVLEKAARHICDHVWVCAPEHEQSAAGHSLTIHSPLRIRTYDEHHMSVFGTPTDSVVVGVKKLLKGTKPHMVLSGVNHGQNTGDDVTYSGTVAAAIEATLLGIPAIAFSQYYNDDYGRPDWQIVERVIPKILQKIAGLELDVDTFLNVNLPLLPAGAPEPEVRVVPQGHYTYDYQNEDHNGVIEMQDPRGRPYYWIGPPKPFDNDGIVNDSTTLMDGFITITPLNINLTHDESMKKLGAIFQ